MAEIIQRDGTWTFDGETVRIVPGGKAHPLRLALGELAVPVEALAGISFEPDRKGGRLRLRLRGGACPVLRAADGRLKDGADPYVLAVEKDRTGVAEYFVDEVRNALLIEQVPEGPVDRFLLAGPSLPVSGGGGDGTASFDGETVRLTWNWKAEESKNASGPAAFPLARIAGVRWMPSIGLENGYLRFEPVDGPVSAPPKYDPYSLELWGLSKKEYTAVVVAAAVLARLPQARTAVDAPAVAPALTKAPAPAPAAVPPADDHDVLLRRLRELGELHRAGVLTDEEFSTAKQAILSRM
ncbi:DUF4429 domain-containing protein [Streptomyces cyaneofuscatus]|uniref:DUF4429 domain-containing protein n=1 Tax=Streptomyces TaxID=1883 RepID=UPI000978D7FE|nr:MULTISPECIES: DUF4429 domain-containing protein [unclassified Streptomyces]ONI54211.1 hypothetical protein STIB_19220 [Streptomyces sp. IB2014 011-1]RDV52396.1 DUF4429 domain-containing protein [Streptomyces sp. IB2014 011-12]CAD5951628.1 conserved protein of unknown function [Streptomyces sp. KY75]CAD5983863.1 conserved protein of unknown function [Streptomyces sp. KY70]